MPQDENQDDGRSYISAVSEVIIDDSQTCRATDEVLGEDVMAVSYGDSNTLLVVLKYVVGHVGVERLHHCWSSVAVVVDITACQYKAK